MGVFLDIVLSDYSCAFRKESTYVTQHPPKNSASQFSFLTLTMLNKSISRLHFEVCVFIPQKNRFRHFMQIVSTGGTLHEMLVHVFWEKYEKKEINPSLAEFAQRVVRVNVVYI